MRRLLIILVLFNASFVFAQKTDSVATRKVKSKNVDGTVMTSDKNIIDNLSASQQFTTLINAIKAADLIDSFKTGTITLLAPSNKAFDKLAPGILDTLLLPEHKADLANLVNYHVISGRITSKDLERQIKAGNGQATLTTLSGSILIARINENRNFILTDENGGQSVVARLDIEQSNGIVFVVDAVLAPKTKK